MSSAVKVRISAKATEALRRLKRHTGLTPNVLCRMAICRSLADPQLVIRESHERTGMEFNRYTLTGDLDTAFRGILAVKCGHALSEDEFLTDHLRDELERGVGLLLHDVLSEGSLDAALLGLLERTEQTANGK